MLAGSSLPVTWRLPDIELPLDCEIESALMVGVGGSDPMDYHALEAMQCMIERRKGGETGVKAVQMIEGDAVWKAGEEGRWSKELLIAALSRSMEAKDGYTAGHTERVSDIAVAIGRRMGYKGADIDALEVGALLHDIGKIGIPERILHKPGPLDDEEWKVMQRHPVLSESILSGIGLSPIVLEVARSSHERIDGKGYPDGLAGEEIPLHARIVLVADAFDALTTDRPYRAGRTARAAMEEIRAHAGTQFCPKVLAALERVYAEEPETLGEPRLRAVESA